AITHSEQLRSRRSCCCRNGAQEGIMASVYIYWVSTTLLCLLYLTSTYMYATKGDWVRKALADLGYPAYLVRFMIVVKIVGPVAGRGIGRATAKLFAVEGAKVAVVSLTPANVDTVVADIEAAGGTAIGVVADISNADQIKAATEKAVAAFGGIDILVNNAFD